MKGHTKYQDVPTLLQKWINLILDGGGKFVPPAQKPLGVGS